MTGRVATPGPHRTRRRPADQRRAHHHQRRGHPGGDVVGTVVQSRCGPTESDIARRAVADHRVQGVDGAVDQHGGHPARRRPQQRRHLGVGGVLGDRFQRRPGQARGVQPRRVAPAQRRQQPSGASMSPRSSSCDHRQAGARQRRSAQRDPGGRRGRRDRPDRAPAGAGRCAAVPSRPTAPISRPTCSAPATLAVAVGEPFQPWPPPGRTARPDAPVSGRSARGRPGSRPARRRPGSASQTPRQRLTRGLLDSMRRVPR